MSARMNVRRREFLGGLLGAGGLLLGARLVGPAVLLAKEGEDEGATFEPNLWVAIDTTGAVSIVAHRSEMGTGIRTALPMALADELGADWEQVTIVQADGDARYGSQNTDGSRSVRRFLPVVREAGAAARLMLIRAAAAEWGVAAEDCLARDHAVHHPATGRSLGFGALAAAAAKLPVPASDELELRPREEWRYIGRGVPLADQEAIVRGAATYGIDFRLPGMRHAVIARSPVLGGRPKEVDDAAAREVAGVLDVVTLEPFQAPHAFQALGGVAVIATSTWAALEGRRRLKIEWEPGPHGSYDTDAEREALTQAAQASGRVVRRRGEVDTALKTAHTHVSATYRTPLLAHASMEPPCAVAVVKDGTCEAWAPTQNPQAAQAQLAQDLGLDPTKVTVHVTLLGGGFGRKSKPDFVVEAAKLSQARGGEPVQVLWTREDDLRHDYYHAPAAVHLEGGLDAQGKPVAWLQRSAFPTIGSTFAAGAKAGNALELGLGFVDLPFAVPHLRAENGEAENHVRIGWLRSVCHIFHAFATSSFADELAHAAGRDPLEFLLELIGEPRHVDLAAEGVEGYPNHGEPLDRYPIDTGRLRRVTELAANKIGWGRELPKGRGLGIASHRSFLSYVATAVEVEVSKDGQLTIPTVHVVADCGLILHPDRVVAQFEGAAVFGASLARTGQITAKQGAVEQSNFHDYPVARMSDAPREIHVHLVENDAPPAGAGEPGVPPFAPALCNAIFAAAGKRIRDLPLAGQDLSWD